MGKKYEEKPRREFAVLSVCYCAAGVIGQRVSVGLVKWIGLGGVKILTSTEGDGHKKPKPLAVNLSFRPGKFGMMMELYAAHHRMRGVDN